MTEETQEPVSVIEQAAPSVEQSVIMETPAPEPLTPTPTLTPTPETPVDLGAKLLDSEYFPIKREIVKLCLIITQAIPIFLAVWLAEVLRWRHYLKISVQPLRFWDKII